MISHNICQRIVSIICMNPSVKCVEEMSHAVNLWGSV